MTYPPELTPPLARALAEAAERLQVRPEDLAAAAVPDLLAHPAPEFQQAARLVLEKNAELYRRLAEKARAISFALETSPEQLP